MNRVAITTRFHFPVDSPTFEWRFQYYRDEVLPRLLDQTDQAFDIWIWAEPHHSDRFRDLSDRIRVFQAPYTDKGERYIQDFNRYEDTVGIPKYPIQIGLDSDDLVAPRFVAKAREFCRGKRSTLVSFQPVLLNVKTGEQFHMRRTYGSKCGSAIFAFYQPDLSNYKFAYHTSHRLMPQLAERTVVVPEGYVLVSVHGHNDSTYIHSRARRYRGKPILGGSNGQPNHR